MSWIDVLLYGYNTIRQGLTPATQRNTLSFTGAGVTVTDDSVNQATQVSISGVGRTGVWTTALLTDFTQQNTQTLSPDANYTIGGQTYTKINSANDATAMVLTNGTGIVIKPVSSTDYMDAIQTAPALRLNLSALIPTFRFDTSLRIWLYVASNNIAANFDGAFLAVQDGGASNTGKNFRQQFNREWNTTLNNLSTQILNSAHQNNVTDQQNTSDNVLVLQMNGGVMADVTTFTGTYASGFPADSSLNLHAVQAPLGATNISGFGNPTTWNLIFGAKRANSGTSLNVTVGAIRVDYQ